VIQIALFGAGYTSRWARRFCLGDTVKEIKLTQGQVAIVCDCHAHLVENHKWYAMWSPDTQSFYAVRNSSRLLGKRKVIYMHTVINNTPVDIYTDHVNNDTLNNTCTNLRNATREQNQRNKRKQSNNSSGYKGVSYDKQARRWMAYISINGKHSFIDYRDSPEAAAQLYDIAAINQYGEFAKLNFPLSDYI
jgi:hypothetical protein